MPLVERQENDDALSQEYDTCGLPAQRPIQNVFSRCNNEIRNPSFLHCALEQRDIVGTFDFRAIYYDKTAMSIIDSKNHMARLLRAS